tara:strand:- start:2161 stop:3204 length:1044 start_codon:yes stop_codon:yes gene_type:complete
MGLKVVMDGDSVKFVEEEDTFKFNNNPESQGYVDPAPAVNSKGGTEMMLEGLKARANSELLDKFQIIPSRVRKLQPKPKILWMHDTFDDPESQHLGDEISRKRFKKIVFVSHYQRQLFQLYHGVKDSECLVMKNAIVPIKAHKKPRKKNGEIRLIYHTTPHRGLELLFPAFEALCKQMDNIVLDVYSGFGIYGWAEKDEPYRELFADMEAHPKVNFHGVQSNATVRKALTKAHIFAYPNIWPETSCIALIEAMSAGCLCIHPAFAALPETAANFSWMYPYNEYVQTHVNMFANILANACHNFWEDDIQDHLVMQKQYFDKFYNWDVRAEEWNSFLAGMAEGLTKEKD